MQIIKVKTKDKRQVIDITDDIQSEVEQSEIQQGVAVLNLLHTTCALSLADLDPGTDQDFLDFLAGLTPKPPDGQWRHPHDPSHAPDHLLSSLIGTSLTLAINNDQLVLGTWQRIILVELDGPRNREVALNILKSA